MPTTLSRRLSNGLFLPSGRRKRFGYAGELEALPAEDPGDGSLAYYTHNGCFEAGDSEALYSVLRHFKPRRLIEIGSGFSTRLAHQAAIGVPFCILYFDLVATATSTANDVKPVSEPRIPNHQSAKPIPVICLESLVLIFSDTYRRT